MRPIYPLAAGATLAACLAGWVALAWGQPNTPKDSPAPAPAVATVDPPAVIPPTSPTPVAPAPVAAKPRRDPNDIVPRGEWEPPRKRTIDTSNPYSDDK